MKLTIHIETTKTEQPMVYQGTVAAEAMVFLKDAIITCVDSGAEPTVVQCNLIAQTLGGEQRALSRVAKGALAFTLINDINWWLMEVDPSLKPPAEDNTDK